MKVICNDKEFNFEDEIALKDLLASELPEDAIAARFNNEVVSLNHPMHKDGKVVFIDRTTKDGREIYVRGLLYLLSMAAYRVYPQARLTINYQLSNSMFCEFVNMEITDEIIENLRKEMDNIISKNLPIIKKEMTPEEAEKFYKEEATIRGKLQLNVKKHKVSLYFCEEFFNYFYGTMPISTGFAK